VRVWNRKGEGEVGRERERYREGGRVKEIDREIYIKTEKYRWRKRVEDINNEVKGEEEREREKYR